MRELLSDTGSIFVHVDWRKVHHIRSILDEVFGPNNFRNEIIWSYKTYQGQVQSYFPRKHDNILWYSKTNTYKFELLKDDEPEKTIDFTRWNKYLNENNEITGENYPTSDSRFDGYLKRFIKENHRKPGPNDVILKIEGNTIDSVWEIKAVDPKNAVERLGYPTQKPEELIMRILKACTNPNQIVFDCFMGSGTTQAVAMKLGRRFIGADINLGAVQTTTKRLNNILKENELNLLDERMPGFEVYNVNNYDFFRNPLEARDLLIEALNIQSYSQTKAFDGELDGRNVKIMPVNRIATKADLKSLIANLPYSTYDKRKEDNPKSPVDYITLICMGHEPDLAAAFKQEVSAYNIDIQIVDILTDKKEFEFKRESKAKIVIEGDKLIIKSFYPMNLMQKLSLQKESIEDYKQLVESVVIDWNYDGEVLKPETIDIPEKNDFIKGVYTIPNNRGRIRVKITDLLSESIEVEVE